jgi:hypothetical protein
VAQTASNGGVWEQLVSAWTRHGVRSLGIDTEVSYGHLGAGKLLLVAGGAR